MPRQRSEHPFAIIVLSCLLALLGALAQASPAAAAACTPITDFSTPPLNAPLPGSCFEGHDGDQVDPDGATPAAPAAPNRLDWGSAEVLAGAQKALDYVQGSADSQFTGGMEESPDTWKWNVGSLGSDKYDLISGYSYQEADTQDLMLALAFVRESNNGTSWLAFELNQKQPGYRHEPLVGAIPARSVAVPTRSTGDLLITYSVSNNNSPKPVIGLCKWVGTEHVGVWTNMLGVPVASNCPALSKSVAQADMNGADILAAGNFLGSPAGLLQAGTFGEASINLTEAFKAAGANPSTEDDCLSFGYFWAHSRSSEPVTSAQQDFILPTDAISAANCSVEGTKWHDKNGNGLLDGTDEQLGGWTIFADYDDDGVKDAGEPSDVTAPKDANDLRPKGSYSLTNLVDGTYPIREVDQAGWQCTSPNPCAHEVDMTGQVIGGKDFLNFQLDPEIQLDKSAELNSAGAPRAGETITYTFKIINTGNVTLSGVDLDDALVGYEGFACAGVTSLAPNASVTCTKSYALAQADVDAGKVDNLADACGDPPSGAEVCDPGDTTTPLPADPKISLDKTAVLVAAGASPAAGDKVDYTFRITNTGNVTLDGVDLDDDLLNYSDVTCNLVTVLAPAASVTCTGSHTLTQADVDAGKVDNLADACGDSPADVEVCDPDDTSTPLPAAPSIALEKTAKLNSAGAPKPGETITYAFDIINTGNVTLDGVDLDDALVGKDDAACGATVLAPGAKTSCTATFTLTQADVDAGKVDNLADACGDSPADVEVCDPDDTSTPLTADPKIDLDKSATLNTGGNGLQAGDTVTYKFVITNIGNVTLDGVDLDDDLLGLASVVCNATPILAPGASTTCTKDYTLTQADVDAGTIDNDADACGDSPADVEVCAPDNTATPLDPNRAIQLKKTGVLKSAGAPKAGEKITYTFEVTNLGNVTLTGVDLDDSLIKYTDVDCGDTVLSPDEVTSCTADYALTQADIDAGSVTNDADACGDSPVPVTEVCDPDTTTTPLAASPSIALEKTGVLVAAGASPKAGDKITYSFEISNTGNVTLSGVDLDDALVGKTDADCGFTILGPGAKTSCTATYTLTQADIDAGRVDNLADACGDSPEDVEVCDAGDTSTPLANVPSIDLKKTGVLNAPVNPKAGDTITYAFAITNTGNVTLSGADLDDALLGKADAACGATTLAPGAKTSCTATYALTQADIDAGKVTNVADVCADPPRNAAEVCDEDTTTTTLEPSKGIVVEKDGPATAYHGDQVTYTFLVSNTGSVTLKPVKVTDDKCAPVQGPVAFVKGDGDDRLEVGEQWRFTCTTKVGDHAGDEANPIVNTVTATGTDTAGASHTDTDTHSTLVLHPAVNIVKSGPAGAEAGQRVGYRLTVTNPGDVPLTGQTLSVTDPQCDAPPQLAGKFRGEAADPTPDTLDPGDSWVYGCFVPTLAGQNQVANTAFVSGEDPNKVRVSDEDSVTTPLTQPQIQVLPKTVVSGAARLSGPSRCVSKAFSAKVTGKRIKKVVWRVDGKRLKTFTSKTGEAKRANLRIDPDRFGEGVHRLSARITFNSAARTDSRTLRMTFQPCVKQIIAPKFTG